MPYYPLGKFELTSDERSREAVAGPQGEAGKRGATGAAGADGTWGGGPFTFTDRVTFDGATRVVIEDGKIRFPDGTAALPSITFADDLDLGFYSPNANEIGGATSGVLRFAVTDTEIQARGDNGANFFDYGPQTTASAANATWTTGGGGIYRLDRSTSSRRYKEAIHTAHNLADVILRPVRFWSVLDETWQYGFIAEEIAEEIPEAAEVANGEVENFDLRAVVAVLAAKVNRLEQQLTDCKNCDTM